MNDDDDFVIDSKRRRRNDLLHHSIIDDSKLRRHLITPIQFHSFEKNIYRFDNLLNIIHQIHPQENLVFFHHDIISKNILTKENIFISPLRDAQSFFKQNNKIKFVIDDHLSDEDILRILDRLRRGCELTAAQRQHVYTVQEFYRAHEHEFLARAEVTAYKEEELKFISSVLGRPRMGSLILDAGCGMGRLTFPLLSMGYDMCGVDISANLIARAKVIAPNHAARFQEGNLMKLPYLANTFHGVLLMWHVISEVSEYLFSVCKELSRVLKHGGVLVLDVPDASSDLTRVHYEGHAGKEGYEVFLAKIPPMEKLKAALEAAGLTIENIHHVEWGIHKFVIVAKKHWLF